MIGIQQADRPTIRKRGKHYQDYILYEVLTSPCACITVQTEQRKKSLPKTHFKPMVDSILAVWFQLNQMITREHQTMGRDPPRGCNKDYSNAGHEVLSKC
jgi:hypothetical protein